jgi:hypothetical protein
MGVRIAYASKPLEADVRAKLTPLGTPIAVKGKATAYNMTEPKDASPFDSVPGIGFDSSREAAAIVPLPGRISGTGSALLVDPAQNNAFRAVNRAWKQGAAVGLVSGASGARYAISGLSESGQADLVKALALVAERSSEGGAPIKKPRVGLFQPWSGSMDEGWTRWLLEQYDFDFVVLRPEDFQTPLTGRIDVVILAEDARIPIEGGAPAGGARGGGARVVRPEYGYALTAADLQAFDAFVRGGGTLIALNSATRWVIQQFKLPVKNAVEGLKPDDFFLRGSIVEVRPDLAHRVMAGMPERAAVFVDGSPVFDTLEGFKGKVLARYADSGSPLLSGYLIGEKYLQGKAAALDVELDQGHVVLLGFRPQWRDQSFGTFRVLFNAALYASGR